ncbi:PREDICTED: C-C chemokine receptor type 6 [Gekko japonicus]|uniref:C-C chemokine receptor type 6 n=1 Tax=Gekko japonicus TaxID=146911 RepID=A0ABM1KVB1_GEKJA|nr:PREDICTED: C-C chemokine receptor type 6 [Gekko japonicus]
MAALELQEASSKEQEEPNSTDYTYYHDFYDRIIPPCDKTEVRNFAKLFFPFAYSLICILGLVGNTFVVMTFSLYKRSKSMTDMCLCNIAIVDILFVITLPFRAVEYALDDWIFGDFMCKLTRGMYPINFNCAMLLLACISVDRYIAIVQATKSFKLRARTLAYSKVICLAMWGSSVVISSSTFIFSQSYIISFNVTKRICEHRSNPETTVMFKLLILYLQLLFGFFIPLLVMSFCYTFIVKTLVKAQNSKRNKAIRVIVLTVIVFLICQLPYNVVLILNAPSMATQEKDCQSEKKMVYAKHLTETLAFLHCCMNPVLYAFIGVKFRNYFLKIMKGLCCVRYKKHGATPTHSSRGSSDAGHSRQTSEIYE